MGLPTWLLLQTGDPRSPFGTLDEVVWRRFFSKKSLLPQGKQVALVVDSLGGQARTAYQVAMLLRRHCGGFVAIVPRIAKSAATLLTLGAERIVLGRHAELGPLDVQLFYTDREEVGSALDELQSLESLFRAALENLDNSMHFLLMRAGKRLDVLLPIVMEFVASMLAPMVGKIDTVHYTRMSRLLSVAEEYAVRLLTPRYSLDEAKQIASRLVENYPDHGFVIDYEEASSFGLRVNEATDDQEDLFAQAFEELGSNAILGPIQNP